MSADGIIGKFTDTYETGFRKPVSETRHLSRINSTINEEEILNKSNSFEDTKLIEDSGSESGTNFVMYRDDASSIRGTILQKGILTESFNERMYNVEDLDRVYEINNSGGYQEIDELNEEVMSSLIDPSVPKPMKITNIAAYV